MSIIPLNKCSDVIIFRKTLKELSMMSPVGSVIEVKNPGHHTELEVRAKTVWESMGMSQDLSQEIKFAIAVFIRKNDHLLPYLDIKEMQELLKLPGMRREDLPVDTILHASNGDVKANLVALRMIPCFAGEAVEQMAQKVGDLRTFDIDLRQVSDAETLNLFLDYQSYGPETLSRLSPAQLIKLFDLAVYFDQDDLRKNIVTKIANLDVEKNMDFLVNFIIKLLTVNKGKVSDIVQVFQNHNIVFKAVSEIIKRPSYRFDQNGRAQLFLGHCFWIYRNGEIGETYNWFGLSAKQGNLEAQELLLRLVQKGDSGAQFELGQCYLEGKGVEKNEKEGLGLLHLAAKKEGNLFAERAKGVLGQYYLELGCCYLEGEGVEKNEKEAVRLLQLSAEQDNLDGVTMLSDCYRGGVGVEKDERKAFELLIRQRGRAIPTSYKLALCFLHGIGTEKNLVEAARNFHYPAVHKYAKAQEYLGYCCFTLGSRSFNKEINKQMGLNLLLISAQLENLEAEKMLSKIKITHKELFEKTNVHWHSWVPASYYIGITGNQ